MKKIFSAGLLLCMTCLAHSQTYDHHFLLAGASFAVPENGWFEIACDAFHAEALNKAVSGESIKNTASDMFNGTFYTQDELERTDAFIIMHVHNQDVANTNGIKENYEDYTYDELQQYHLAYDYVIKKYCADCRNLREDPNSAYYQTENGKPATIILCTHWHDARISYNQSIRTLAERRQLPLIEWDENIGFTRKETDADGRQPSIAYSCDTETLYGITFGWHPLRGKEQYIQQKMAQIAMTKLSELFTPAEATATICEKSKLIANGEEAYVACTFTGVPPWRLDYSVNGQPMHMDDILMNPQIISVGTATGPTSVRPAAVSNAHTANGDVFGGADIRTCDAAILPSFDTYAHQANKTSNYATDDHLEVKGNSDTHTRETFISFNTEGIQPNAGRIVLRAYYYDCVYPGWPRKETHRIEIAGNTEAYTSLTWNTKPDNFTTIGYADIRGDELGSYIDWDVTGWANEQIAAGKNILTFRLRLGDTDGTGLLYFHSSESAQAEKPQLLISAARSTAHTNNRIDDLEICARASGNEIALTGIDGTYTISCLSLQGQTIFSDQISNDGIVKLPVRLSGIYILELRNNQRQHACIIMF